MNSSNNDKKKLLASSFKVSSTISAFTKYKNIHNKNNIFFEDKKLGKSTEIGQVDNQVKQKQQFNTDFSI